jgi:CDP-6-deoxy-D-xylo-4-hexulose-3-dehydrase
LSAAGKAPVKLDWPLMHNNITREDRDALIAFIDDESTFFTQSTQVRAFEREWSEWLGVKHSVFVNSGASANLVTITALRELKGRGEVIVPTLAWVSDIAVVLQAGLTPVFVDIDPRTLGMSTDAILAKLTKETRAVFLTHVLGYSALTRRLLDELAARGIPLIEDTCESYGATFEGGKLGTYGWVSNFSFYYAHHLTTAEGGMVSTNDPELYEVVRMLRSHGLVRESTSEAIRSRYTAERPDLDPNFIFAFPGFNVRSTELAAVVGRTQLKRLDANNEKRRRNLELFLGRLDPEKYRTDFALEGSCNYAFTLVLRRPDDRLRDAVVALLQAHGVEYRRGTAGGGNQLRQPYLRRLFGDEYARYPEVDHVHFYGFYIGNYPDLDAAKVETLCALLNAL